MEYSYRIGQIVGRLHMRHGNIITSTALGNIAQCPTLWRACLRHIDLSDIAAPEQPIDWEPSAIEWRQFWDGYYKAGLWTTKDEI